MQCHAHSFANCCKWQRKTVWFEIYRANNKILVHCRPLCSLIQSYSTIFGFGAHHNLICLTFVQHMSKPIDNCLAIRNYHHFDQQIILALKVNWSGRMWLIRALERVCGLYLRLHRSVHLYQLWPPLLMWLLLLRRWLLFYLHLVFYRISTTWLSMHQHIQWFRLWLWNQSKKIDNMKIEQNFNLIKPPKYKLLFEINFTIVQKISKFHDRILFYCLRFSLRNMLHHWCFDDLNWSRKTFKKYHIHGLLQNLG